MINKKKIETQINKLSEEISILFPSNINSELALEELVRNFLNNFPVFEKHKDYHGKALEYVDSAYTFFGVLNSILSKYVENRENEDLVINIINWANNLYDDPKTNESIKNLLAIEFFEKADESNTYANFLKTHLVGEMSNDFKVHIKEV